MRHYAYKSLKPDSIRLLHLRPALSDLVLRGNLIHHDKPPPYKALSYAWGSNHKPRSILIAGRTMPITQSLYDALIRFRCSSTLVIWADAICINQEDEAEKTAQVLRMRSIYSNADVLIWLGFGERIVPYLRRIEFVLRQHVKPDQIRVATIQAMQSLAHLRESVKRDLRLSWNEWRVLDEFYGASWFSRVWVFQEVVVAKSATVFYGSESFSWDTLAFVTNGLLVFDALNIMTSGYSMVQFVEQNRSEPQQTTPFLGRYSSMWSHISISRGLQATDPRDKWFAFAGLLDVLPPDYGKSVAQTFTEVTKYFLDRGCIDVWEFLDDEDTRLDLPSWVCDLSRTGPDLLLKNTATGGFLPYGISHRLSPDDVPVCLVDRISKLVAPNHGFLSHELSMPPEGAKPFDLTEADRQQLRIELLRNAKHFAAVLQTLPDCESYVTGEAMKEAFFRTTLCDTDVVDAPISDSLHQAFVAYYDWQVALIASEYDPAKLLNLESVVSLALSDSYKQKFEALTSKRQFMASEKGLIGWVPRRARQGDLVCIIPGARLPYIIRKHGDAYQLIGHSYVHGLMDEMVSTETNELNELLEILNCSAIQRVSFV